MSRALSAHVLGKDDGYCIVTGEGSDRAYLFTYWHSGGKGVFEFSRSHRHAFRFDDHEHACYLAQKVGQDGYICTVCP